MTDIFTPHVSRRDLGSPVVNLSGEVLGLNIGSHSGFFTYAIPATFLRECAAELIEL